MNTTEHGSRRRLWFGPGDTYVEVDTSVIDEAAGRLARVAVELYGAQDGLDQLPVVAVATGSDAMLDALSDLSRVWLPQLDDAVDEALLLARALSTASREYAREEAERAEWRTPVWRSGWLDLGDGELSLGEPGFSEPGVTEPGVTEPGVTEPGLSEHGVTEPGVTEPGLTEHGLSEPGASGRQVLGPPIPAGTTPAPDVLARHLVGEPR